ncbi:MAG: Uma2 family endonuclease [Verrucomicrobiae bacterium]|nr:Uma2 family endonuclease [Verrucomicrobiae bacterium]
MSALKYPPLVSIDDYLAGEIASSIKHEYLGGVLHAMAGGSNRHNAIALNCLLSLGAQLRGKSCRPFNSDTKVRIRHAEQTRFYYPDFMVVCEQNPDSDFFQDHPTVIGEVLSDSTRRTDLGEKLEAYLDIPSLNALILVEPDTAAVTVHRRLSDGSGFRMERFEISNDTISLPEIDAELPLSEVYEAIDFSDNDKVT